MIKAKCGLCKEEKECNKVIVCSVFFNKKIITKYYSNRQNMASLKFSFIPIDTKIHIEEIKNYYGNCEPICGDCCNKIKNVTESHSEDRREKKILMGEVFLDYFLECIIKIPILNALTMKENVK